MIDNFELIKSLLFFESEDIYYHLQILRRGKDHPELPAANRCIKAYFICGLESLDALEDEIKKLCEFFQARAYINLSPKSIKRTAAFQMKYLAQRMYEGDYKKIWKSWNTCAGEIKGEKPRWVVDLDNMYSETNEKEINSIRKFIDEIIPITLEERIICEIPTKSGIHLITTPFNLLKFKEVYPNIDVHKNNPTILYIP